MINRFLFVSLLFSSFMGCTPQIAKDANPVPSVSPQAIPAKQSSTAPAKTTIIQVSGKPQTIPLGLVETPYFSTYFPTDRFVLDSSSAASGNIKLYWKRPDGTVSKNTLVGFIVYDKNQKLQDVKATVDGFALAMPHGGRKVEQSPAISYAKKTYSTWLRDLTRIEITKSPNVADSGVLTSYFGEVNGQVFLVASAYALQYGDDFTAREDVILKNLKIKQRN